jgi:poly(A) polymerase
LPEVGAFPGRFSEWFERVRQALPAGLEIYLVGGAVRDALLGIASHDLDFVMPGDAPRAARQVANAVGGAYYLLDGERGAGRVVLNTQASNPVTLDFTRQRGPDLESDLRARDFTVNAMAVSVWQPDELIDPLGGQADLADRRLRVCSPKSFQEDALRILRAARLADAYQLSIDRDTLRLIAQAIPALPRVSAERRRDELFRILESSRPESGLERLVAFGAADACFPVLEQVRQGRDWSAALNRVRDLHRIIPTLGQPNERDPQNPPVCHAILGLLDRYHEKLLRRLGEDLVIGRSPVGLLVLAAVYQGFLLGPGVGQNLPLAFPQAPSKRGFFDRVGRQLMLSNPEIEQLVKADWSCCWIFHQIKMGMPPSNREIYLYFQKAGAAGVLGSLLALAVLNPECGTPAGEIGLQTSGRLLAAWWDTPERLVDPPQLVDGNDLQRELSIAPGPQLGRLLEEIRESQVDGLVADRSQALDLARRWLIEQVK